MDTAEIALYPVAAMEEAVITGIILYQYRQDKSISSAPFI